ncbi:MAG: 2'-5' RNA ligase family protein [Eubacteriales bacterium]|nr:2'-5' RNA ligase family protein [Eubacteriales bacterium]
MEFGLLLTFDQETEQKLNDLIQHLVRGGANETLLLAGLRPHLTLAEFDTHDIEAVDSAITQLTAEKLIPISIKLASAGFFPNNLTVLYLAPIVDESLLQLHRDINDTLEPLCTGFSPLYREENWVPHCTLALELTPESFAASCLNLADYFTPMEPMATHLSLIACCPFCEQKRYPLAGSDPLI